MLESARLNLARGRADLASSDLAQLEATRASGSTSINVIAAIEEKVLLRIHQRTFAGLEDLIRAEFVSAQQRADVALTMVLRMWLARVHIESGDLGAAEQESLLSWKSACESTGGKVKVRALAMLLAAYSRSDRTEDAKRMWKHMELLARSMHLPLHNLLAAGIQAALFGEPSPRLPERIVAIANRGELPFFKALLHEYHLQDRLWIDGRKLEDFIGEMRLSPAIFNFVREQTLVFLPQPLADPDPSGMSYDALIKSETRQTEDYSSESVVGTLIRRLLATTPSGQLPAAEIHNLFYPSVPFRMETHGARVRNNVLRLRKHIEARQLPLRMDWDPENKCYHILWLQNVLAIDTGRSAGC